MITASEQIPGVGISQIGMFLQVRHPVLQEVAAPVRVNLGLFLTAQAFTVFALTD